MMLLIEHRVNTLEHLHRVPPERGIEIDIRDYRGELRLAHDPFKAGERLEALLAEFRHAFIIFNTKCDGLVGPILTLAKKYNLQNFFFLDLANPTLINLARSGERRIAVRYSEFEPLEFALTFAGQVDWVWVDCFTRFPLDIDIYRQLRQHFNICLVSPEMQGHARAAIAEYRQQLAHMPIDAVCSDFCDDWL